MSSDKTSSDSTKTTRRRNRLYERVEDQSSKVEAAQTKAAKAAKPSRAKRASTAKAAAKAQAEVQSDAKPEVVESKVIKKAEPKKKKGLSAEQLKFAAMLDQVEQKHNEADAKLAKQRKQDADETIVNHAMTAGGFGLIPIPIVDLFATANIQYALVTRLAQIYGHRPERPRLKGLITALVGSVASYAIGKRLASSLFKGVPWGAWTVSLPMAATDGIITYAIGKAFQRHFSAGGTLKNFNLERAKRKLPELMEEGSKLLINKKRRASAS